MKKIPLIDVTDLYHPYQDIGDNFDLIMPYALPQIDLKAVILDVTDNYRQPVGVHRVVEYSDRTGPRDPGIIPVSQLNYIFDRNIPFACGPFTAMTSPGDTMPDCPAFQARGVDLILEILEKSEEKVEIAIFSSARPVAVAYNRNPELFMRKVSRIHLCAGSSSPIVFEWNVELDPHAFVCLLRSPLPIALYPCACDKGAFRVSPHNCFWKLENLEFIKRMDKKLQPYIHYAFNRVCRNDFLRVMEDEPPQDEIEDIARRSHSVWETAIWIEAARKKLVQGADGHYRLPNEGDVLPDDRILTNIQLPCTLEVEDSGLFTFTLTDQPTNFTIYTRDDPEENQTALQEAFPALYSSFIL